MDVQHYDEWNGVYMYMHGYRSTEYGVDLMMTCDHATCQVDEAVLHVI